MKNDGDAALALVVGASGGLGRAICEQWRHAEDVTRVIAVSRRPPSVAGHAGLDNVLHIPCNYSEPDIAAAVRTVGAQRGSITRVCICNGILHNERVWPEKRIEEVGAAALHEVFAVNSIILMFWLKVLLPIVKGPQTCVVSILSARVGSISDNRFGGWYSYRASKAALNMLLKTAAIEYARRASNVKLIAFQPGTADTGLSKPFQASVRPEDLRSPRFVAEKLVGIMNNLSPDGELSFLDWDNQAIAW